MAHRVHHRTLDYDNLIGELKQINLDYQSDSGFESILRWEGYYSRRYPNDIKYILSEYEIHLRKMAKEPLTLAQEEILSSDYQVEHIWPQKPSNWDCMSSQMRELHGQNIHKLGNLTIASKSWNSSIGNKPFTEKKFQSGNAPSYTNSSLWVQRELAKQNKWDAATIKKREDKIVEFSLRRWSV